MRFYLDNDVDATCRKVVLGHQGHECWTANQAGLANADDWAQEIYAAYSDAVLVTHDRQFTTRAKRHTIGRHVLLACEHPDGPDVFERWFPRILDPLEHLEHLEFVGASDLSGV